MSRARTTEAKKILVRNPALPIPKTITVVPSKASVSSKIDSDTVSSSKHGVNKVCSNSIGKTRFNVPQINSTLKLSKRIDEVVQMGRSKHVLEADEAKLAVDEKVAKKVNFPYGKQVFKDLIPLTDNELKVQPVLPTRGPVYQKDKEPVLADFLQPRKPKVHYHKPKISVRDIEEQKMNIPTSNCLRLYKILQVNEDCQ